MADLEFLYGDDGSSSLAENTKGELDSVNDPFRRIKVARNLILIARQAISEAEEEMGLSISDSVA